MRRPRRQRSLEARAEHPGARALTRRGRTRVIGIDLGTTNSALAWAETARRRSASSTFRSSSRRARSPAGPTLPSFLYFTDQAQRDAGTGAAALEPAPELVAGVFARDEGALVPVAADRVGQVVAVESARRPHGARSCPGAPKADRRLSPVEASARVLAHLRDAWNHERAPRRRRRSGSSGSTIVLTVPASFDEEARELTVQAAREAGLDQLTLLEEPLAALYAWIAAHRRAADRDASATAR